jgi:hypothetical protein
MKHKNTVQYSVKRSGGRVNFMKNIISMLAIMVMFLVFSMPGSASAREEARPDTWKFGAELYLWLASLGGAETSGGDIDVDFDALLDDLEMAFMGGLQARKGRWSFMIDAIYLNASADNSSIITLPVDPGVEVTVNSSFELKNWVVSPYVGYNVAATDKVTLDILAGARYLWMEADLAVSVVDPPINEATSDSGHMWDGIVGFRGEFILSEKWYLPFHFDIGTGDTDLTWQAYAGVGYQFKRINIEAAYRYLEWDFDDNDVLGDMDVSGPMFGLRYSW